MDNFHLALVDLGASVNSPWGQSKSLADFAGQIITLSHLLAGLILFFYLFFGGFTMISGAGHNDPQSVARGKQAVTSALIGFAIIFVSYWMLELVDYIFDVPFL